MKEKWMKMDCGHEKVMIEKHLCRDKNQSFYIIEWYCKTCGMYYEECDRGYNKEVFISESLGSVFKKSLNLIQDPIIDNYSSIDLHGKGLWKAKNAVEEKIRESVMLEIDRINIIHGYHGGTVLRNYFLSKKFYIDMKIKGFYVKGIKMLNYGSTIFKIRKIKENEME